MIIGSIRLFLAFLALSSPSAFASGPGIPPFEDGKGTIGLLCTDASGEQFSMPSFTTAPEGRRIMIDAFNSCLHRVQVQWNREVLAAERGSVDFVDRDGRGISIYSYIDGHAAYVREADEMRSSSIRRRSLEE